MRTYYGQQGQRRGFSLSLRERGLWAALKTFAVLVGLIWPAGVFAHHGHPTVVGWVLEVIWLAVLGVWRLGRWMRRRGA